MPAVEFSGVYKRYPNGTAAVSNLDLRIGDGEYICVLGPSGCGKSSTLRMLAGLEAVSDGNILIDGKRINDLPPQDRNMAMVFENYALYPHLTVFDNIAMPLVARDRPKEEIGRRVAAVAETLGLASMLKRRPHELSGGQRQRVSVGRAIIRQPKMFLLDEPLGHLEAYMRVTLRAEIRRLHERIGTTTVHITHDQEEAAAVSDRIAVIDKGRLQQFGTILDLLDAPVNRFVAEFLGSPPINMLPATVSDAGDGLAAVVAGAVIPLPTDAWGSLRRNRTEGAITLGIRPEHIRLAPQSRTAGIPGKVLALEPQGEESVIIVDTDVGHISLVAASEGAPGVGAPVRIEPDGIRVHLFDADGGSLRAALATHKGGGA